MFVALILYVLFLSAQCLKQDYQDLRKMLSKKDLQGWLYNETLPNKMKNNRYCDLCCIKIGAQTTGKKCGSHTLCKYPAHKTGPACKGYIPIVFTHNEQQAILDAHNTLRNLVANGDERRGKPGPQPSAANMRAVEWNFELAAVAERWAAQCIYANDICRDLERFPVGQNIAHGNLATNNELSLVKGWFDEVANFNNSEVNRFEMPPKGIHLSGKYTQLVWADTYQIGCARAVFQHHKGSEVVYREHLICNYGPAGNIPDQPVYLSGVPCSACPEGTSCTLDYPALCSGDGEVVYRLMEANIDAIVTTSEISMNKSSIIKPSLILIFFISYTCLFYYNSNVYCYGKYTILLLYLSVFMSLLLFSSEN